MKNTAKAKWIGCLAAVAVFALAGTATANARDHHRHDGGNTAVQIVRAIVDLLDGPDIIVNRTPVIAPAPVVVQPAPVIVQNDPRVRYVPAPPRREVRYAPPRREVKHAPKHQDKKAKAPAKKANKGGKGRR